MLSRWHLLIPCFCVFFVVPLSASKWRSNDTECVGVPPGQTPRYKGNADIILDEVLNATSAYLRKENNTQMDIPDQISEFKFFFFTGNLSLSEGRLSGYDKINRVNSADIEYFDKGTSGSLAVKFSDASVFYKMNVHISNSVIKGTIRASLEQLSMRINMSVNMVNLCKKIDSVKVENLNSIKVKSDIDVWIPSYLANTLVNTATWLYKNKLGPFIEERTSTAVQAFLNSVDLEELLRPPDDTGASTEGPYLL